MRHCILIWFGLAMLAVARAENVSRPNFVVFIADDLGYQDLGCYGHPHIRTPNIDALAADGLRFDRAYLTCSSCSPSRCSILTSRYPHATGAGELHLPLPASQTLVTTPLRESGYWTAASGKWHLGNEVIPQFDDVDQQGGPGGEDHWVATLKKRPAEKPFFLWLAASDPHRPYAEDTIDSPHTPTDVMVPPIFPDVPEVREDLADYYDEITRFDSYVGKVVDELRSDGELDNTVIFILSDNGRPWPHCKTRVNVDGVRTPLIVHWPAGKVAHGATNSLVSSIDLSATVLELAGVARPASFQGISLAEVLTEPEKRVRSFAFAEHNWHDYRARERAVHTETHAYIRNSLPSLPATPPADAVRSPTYIKMQSMHAAGELAPAADDVFRVSRDPVALYDIDQDPHCLENVLGEPEVADVSARLRAALDAFTDLTNDRYSGDADTLTHDGFDRETGLRLKK